MKTKLLAVILLFFGISSATFATKVIRLVPTSGEEKEFPVNTLQKVVFTADSIVIYTAGSGTMPLYRNDYCSLLFAELQPTETNPEKTQETPQGTKFIKDGQLYIRIDDKIYSITGTKIQ